MLELVLARGEAKHMASTLQSAVGAAVVASSITSPPSTARLRMIAASGSQLSIVVDVGYN